MDWVTDITKPVHELHAVFAVTVYGDKIRVTHYESWDKAINVWDWLDGEIKFADLWKGFIKYVCVRSWNDPEWNQSRYRTFGTVHKTAIQMRKEQ